MEPTEEQEQNERYMAGVETPLLDRVRPGIANVKKTPREFSRGGMTLAARQFN